ncbi:MAG: ABC transporter permease [Chloroflexi bacterium]|nr:ABC transporter permease [Chloroflexota bacterium]
MNRSYKELNAVVAIAARDVVRFARTPRYLIESFIYPLVFMGLLGGSLAQNLGGGANFSLSQFMLYGVVVMMLYQSNMGSVISLLMERDNNFTQVLFVAPISRYAIIIGKIIGGTITSLFTLLGVFAVALLMQIPFALSDVGNVLLLAPVICIAGGALGILFIGIINDAQAANQSGAILVFTQVFLAGLLFPVSQSSGILSVLSHLMPMTYLGDLMRNLVFAGHPDYDEIVLYSPAVDLAVTIGVTVMCIVVGTVLFVRSERNR